MAGHVGAEGVVAQSIADLMVDALRMQSGRKLSTTSCSTYLSAANHQRTEQHLYT